MEDNKIPYIAFEAEMARYERTIKRLLKALVIAIALLFVSNVAVLMVMARITVTDIQEMGIIMTMAV